MSQNHLKWINKLFRRVDFFVEGILTNFDTYKKFYDTQVNKSLERDFTKYMRLSVYFFKSKTIFKDFELSKIFNKLITKY